MRSIKCHTSCSTLVTTSFLSSIASSSEGMPSDAREDKGAEEEEEEKEHADEAEAAGGADGKFAKEPSDSTETHAAGSEANEEDLRAAPARTNSV